MEARKGIIYKINQWRIQKISNRNFLVILAVVVGLIGGLAASGLKALTHGIAAFLQNDVQSEYKYYLYLFFPLIGILLTVIYVRRFIRRGKFEHGITPILYAISRKSSRIENHNVYSQIITSALTVGFGGSAGLEAPIAYSGSAIGSNVARFFGLNYREVTMLLACGAAAGIAGAFNSPVAGMVFAIEILLPEFSIPAFIPLLMAAATASVVSRVLYSEPLFYLVSDEWVLPALFFYVVLGGLVGLFSIYFTKVDGWVKTWFSAVKNPYHKVWLGGLSLGVLIFVFPALYGEGYIAIQQLLLGKANSLLANSIFSDYKHVGWMVIVYSLITVFAKSFGTLITLNSGGNGGTFGPSLVMGGLLGFVFAHGINLTGLTYLTEANFIVAGMAAALSGIMHAPLTAIFLIAEITGGYTLMVPLMIVSAISYFINRATVKYSIYTKNLAIHGDWLSHEDKDKTVLRMMKLRYVLETNFTVLHPDEKPVDRRSDIIHTKRNIFPVVDENRKLLGVIYSERLFSILMGEEVTDKTMKELAQAPLDVVRMNANMYDVMRKMDREDIWILPVLDDNDRYMGFVSKSAIFNKYRALLVRQGAYLD
ncbi:MULTISPECIES: chloride channel protein [Olivibacter]|uniref:Cl-channel voltage-gated family protein n=3 Tax=Sphingobacteriaceae TaxID=84566 RepID=F4C3V8_SPHS2|nr:MULTISPECIES: chloride channel protein [Olivibacter]MCL4640623.1 chloride channel protein [Olivibacter sp. UJ_SKK_5.1]MDM8174884.1 chloride channel protein [Olivibacter sp. 47]MDX3913436.1 chloride channel protein [Pseudosphingobacterium sp.]